MDGHHGQPPLDPVEPAAEALGGVVESRQQQPGTQDLEQQPRRGGAAHLGQPGADEVGSAGQLGAAEPAGLAGQPLGLVAGQLDQTASCGVGDSRDDHEVAQPVQQVLGEAPRVLAGVDDLLDDAEQGAAVIGSDRIDGLVEQAVRACSRAAPWRSR